MGSGGLGGGMMFLVIALLWGAVLVPAWFRRREFNAAERNALRLQRTLRVLAETAELPQEMRIEATAREALAHERMLRTAQKRQEAEREAELAEARVEQVRAEIRAQQMQRKQVAMNRAAKLRKPIVRRVRSVAALLGLVGLVGVLVGAGMLIAGVGPAVLLQSLLAFTIGLGTLVILAPGRAKLAPIAAERVVESVEPAAQDVTEEIVELEVTDETHGTHESAQRAAAARIERARAMARARETRVPAPRVNQPNSMLLREARELVEREWKTTASSASATNNTSSAAVAPRTPEPSPKPAAATPPTSAKTAPATPGLDGLNAMGQLGVVGDTSEGMPNLDQVMRRRRNAG